MRSNKTFLFFIVDGQGRSAYWEDEIVKWQSTPRPLRRSPDGWKDTEIGFVRSNKYFGINRQFSNQYKFVDDGANILRHLVYTQSSYETKVYLIVAKWDPDNDIYNTYYRGEIDLVKMQDEASTGITANMVEGDLLKLLNASEDTEYEIGLENHKLVQVDGVALQTTQQYVQLDIGVTEFALNHVSPLFLSTSEGTPVNLTFNQSQEYESQVGTDADFYTESQNCIIRYSDLALSNISFRLHGKFTVSLITSNASPKRGVYILYLIKATDNDFEVRTQIGNHVFNAEGEMHVFDVDETVTLSPGQKLFIAGRSFANTPADGVEITMQFGGSSLTANATDRYRSSLVKAIAPNDLYSELLLKIAGTHPFNPVSTLLDDNAHLLCTSGDAIREIAQPVIKTTFSRFFDSFNKILFAGFGVSGLNCIMESRGYFYDDANDTIDIGEVSEMRISVAEDQLVNTAKIGYPNQDIENLNGRFGFNNTNIFTLPVVKVKKEYDQQSQYLTDPYAIESIRANFTGRETTDSKTDNSVFILNTVEKPGFNNVGMAYAGAQGYFFTFSDMLANIGEFNTGDYFIVSDSANGLDGSYLVLMSEIDGPFLFVYVVQNENENVVFTDTANISFPLQLKRLAYDTITGVPEDSEVYNIEQLTPKRMLNAHAPYYRSLLYFLSEEKMAFSTADRNKDLATTIDSVTVIENDDVRADTLGEPMFYPFLFNFKTRVPLNFNDLFVNAVNGHVAFSYNGISLYGFPIQMKVMPGLNESQEWRLLASPANDLADLVQLLSNPLQSIEMSTYGMAFSKLCPIQFFPEVVVQLPTYNFKHMDAYSYANQSGRYDGYRPYVQKWQTSDNIALQCITRDLGPVQAEVINQYGRVFGIYPLEDISTTAVSSPYILYEGDIPLLTFEPGTYWIRVTAGIDGAKVIFLSEPICLQDEWQNTLYLEYSNSRNQAATIFSTGYSPAIRVEGNIIDFLPRSRVAMYEDQPANMFMLDGTAFRQFTLFIGDSFGLPNYMADKVNRIFTLDNVRIDGKGFVRDEDAQLEPVNRVNGMPGTWWRLGIREAQNLDAISQDTDGELNGGAILVNVDAALFGDLTEQVSSNPIQIELLEDN